MDEVVFVGRRVNHPGQGQRIRKMVVSKEEWEANKDSWPNIFKLSEKEAADYAKKLGYIDEEE